MSHETAGDVQPHTSVLSPQTRLETTPTPIKRISFPPGTQLGVEPSTSTESGHKHTHVDVSLPLLLPQSVSDVKLFSYLRLD